MDDTGFVDVDSDTHVVRHKLEETGAALLAANEENAKKMDKKKPDTLDDSDGLTEAQIEEFAQGIFFSLVGHLFVP